MGEKEEERIEALESKVEELLNRNKDNNGWKSIASKENDRRKKCSKSDFSMTEEKEEDQPSTFAEALKKGLAEEAGKDTDKKTKRNCFTPKEMKKRISQQLLKKARKLLD